VDELEDEWPAGNDALTTREKITTYDAISQKPNVRNENPETIGGRLTFRGHWTFLQTGCQPFTKQNRIKGAFNDLSAGKRRTTASCGMSSSPPFEINDHQGGFLVHKVA
jgi:hypothetical protein